MIRGNLRILFCILFTVSMLSNVAIKGDAITVQHIGQTDPSTEGFVLYHGTQSGGTDTLPYWEITSSSSAAAAYLNGIGGWNDPAGWTANVVAKVVSGSPGGFSTTIGSDVAQVYTELLDGSDRWDIHLIDGTGADPAGMYVVDCTGQLAQLAAVDVTQYHAYSAVYNPAGDGGNGMVNYYLDGTLVGARNRSQALDSSLDWVAFGSPAIASGTTSRWNEFTFKTGQDPAPGPPDPPAPVVIGAYHQLFVDNAMVRLATNVTYTLHQPVKHSVGGVPTPMMAADQPWELNSIALYGTTIYDEQEKVYKMWYRSLSDTVRLCYATSPDGINWTKPNLGLSSYGGSTDNNILGGIGFYTDGFGVIKDLDDPDPARRYKMLCYKSGDSFAAMVSPDGINWSGPINPGIHNTGDVLSMYYDKGLGKYVGLTKRYGPFHKFCNTDLDVE